MGDDIFPDELYHDIITDQQQGQRIGTCNTYKAWYNKYKYRSFQKSHLLGDRKRDHLVDLPPKLRTRRTSFGFLIKMQIKFLINF